MLSGRRRETANSIIAKTELAQSIAASRHPVVQQVTGESVAFGRELSDVIDKQPPVAYQRTQLEAQLVALEKEFERAQDRLKYSGYGSGLGHLLIDQRRRIPDLTRLQQDSKIRTETVARIGLRSIEIDDQINELSDIAAEAQRRLTVFRETHGGIDDSLMIQKDLSAVLKDQEILLRLLAENYSSYLRALGDAEFAAQQLAAIVRSYGNYLDKKITWIPNAPMLGTQMIFDSARAVDWLLSVEKWRSMLLDARQGFYQYPLRYGAWMVGLIVLLWARRRLTRVLVDVASKLRNIRTDKFRYTLVAITASMMLSAPWAIFLALAATLLRAASAPSEFSLAFAHALWSLAPVAFVLNWLRRLLRENGVGRQHFRWPDWLTIPLRQSTIRLQVVFVPAYFIAVLFEHQDNASYQYGVGRLAFITAMVAVILYFYRLVHRDGVMVKHLVLRYPGSLITRVHLMLGAVAVLLPVSFALLASVGYYYTALNLNRYLM